MTNKEVCVAKTDYNRDFSCFRYLRFPRWATSLPAGSWQVYIEPFASEATAIDFHSEEEYAVLNHHRRFSAGHSGRREQAHLRVRRRRSRRDSEPEEHDQHHGRSPPASV